MTELERTLRELAGELEYPPTPGLAAAVEQRLGTRRHRWPARRWRLAAALAVALAVPAAAVAAVPPIRDAVLELIGVKGVQVVRTPRLPPLPPRGELDLGRPVTLARARSLVRFRVLTPGLAELGAPDEVGYRPSPPGGALTLVYRARPRGPRSTLTDRGLLLTEFRGTDATLFARKFVGPGTAVESLDVDGGAGVWLAGRPHEFGYVDAKGRTRTESLRLAGDTLLWARGGLTLRLEGARSKQAALRIARSLR